MEKFFDFFKNDKTKKPIMPSFVLYIEYTFIHFGMSISCKQGSLLISKYKYWFKMLKRLKFPPLINACASSANCTMGNLTCSRHATYLHTIYIKYREIHILSTI